MASARMWSVNPPPQDPDRELGEPPPEIHQIFQSRVPAVKVYARILATDGIVRGLIGPREVPKIWDRHILNSAVLSELIQADEAVLDLGSGAGLPGVVLGI